MEINKTLYCPTNIFVVCWTFMSQDITFILQNVGLEFKSNKLNIYIFLQIKY